MKKNIFLILLIIVLFTINTPSYGIFDLNTPQKISAKDINSAIDTLSKKYPEYIRVETIGYSVSNNPIKVLQISNKINLDNNKLRYNPVKKNSLYLAGLHAKEVITPIVFLEIVDKNLEKLKNGDQRILNVFNKNTIHFIPLMNPDGFDLSKHGNVHDIFGRNFNRYLKANTNGIDLNNNFPDKFYDLEENKWNSIENKAYLPSIYISFEPSVAYYWGKEIQPETKAVTEYMKRYYFEYFIDLHSQGDYIYWDHWNLSKEFRMENFRFAKTIQKISTSKSYVEPYKLGERSKTKAPHGFGYSTAYFASLYDNPTITLEVAKLDNLPYANSSHYYEGIDRFKDIFYELNKYRNVVHPYRVYINQELYGDYSHKEYATAVADDINGFYIYDTKNLKSYSGEVINQNFFDILKFVFGKKNTSKILENYEIIKSTSD